MVATREVFLSKFLGLKKLTQFKFLMHISSLTMIHVLHFFIFDNLDV